MPVKPGCSWRSRSLGVRLLRARLLALGDGEEIVPVLHPQDVAGVAGAEEDQPRQKAAGVGEEVEQFLAGKAVAGAAGFGKLQQVQVPVPAPVDDVVAAVLPNLAIRAVRG